MRLNPNRTTHAETDLAAFMLEECQRRKWTTVELARRLTNLGCGINQSGCWKIMHANRRITLDEAVTLCQVFGVDLERFTGSPTCGTCKGSPPAGFRCSNCGRAAAA